MDVVVEAPVRLACRFRRARRRSGALFDAEDRLTALNDEYRSVNPMAQKILENGGTYEDLIRSEKVPDFLK